MLSYRHAFHAGGFADVLKHAVLIHALRHAVRKATPVYFLDTHAGAGSYDLGSAMAQKTGEYLAGIARLLAAQRPVPELVARTCSWWRPPIRRACFATIPARRPWRGRYCERRTGSISWSCTAPITLRSRAGPSVGIKSTGRMALPPW